MDVLSDVLAALRTGRPHAARTQTQAPWGVRFPASSAAGCHVVLQGAVWLIPAEGTPLALGPGDVVFIPQNNGYALADHPDSPLVDWRPTLDDAPVGPASAPGQVRIDGPGATSTMLCAAYYFDRDRSHPLLDELPGVIHLPAHVGRRTSLGGAVDLLGAELSEPRAGTTAILSSLVDMLLLFTLRTWFDEQTTRTTTGWATALADPALRPALQAIHRQPERQWTVVDLAGVAGLSRAAFAKRFATIVGRPPLAYLTWWRMTLAAQLLRDSDLPLRTIAARTGYTTEFALTKAFKREYAQPPSHYRRQSA
ncbi:AraC family transcriptional regulator [Kribbella sp. NBC_01245]|uniref:AraC family transcriptional regulator n=1 Tax=Kribbella sp. NBC_01245 TaxID=2903578 RepID=UPI002E299585|nr:AraC family transcriptional regulator [Kribbella sp. NBC_01245]